jgi:hypothetical protein
MQVLYISILQLFTIMEKIKLSIACCVSDLRCYFDLLVDSTRHLRNKFDISFIPIYNTNNIYNATIAGNIAIECSKDRYLMFVHQDVIMSQNTSDVLYDAIVNKDDDCVIMGSAGIKLKSDENVLGRWCNLDKDSEFGLVRSSDGTIIWGDKNEGYVQSLDEMMLVIDRSSGIRFDPTIHGYHMYGLDICLQARSAGYNVSAHCMDIVHHEKYSNSIYKDRSFMSNLIKVHRKWNRKFRYLYAPYCSWVDNRIVNYIPFSLKNESERIDVTRFSIEV